MSTICNPSQCYVVKSEQINALNYLGDDCPKPEQLEWINRATDQNLRPTSVNQLLRTLYRDEVSESVAKLKDTTGLRAIFSSESSRNDFASKFRGAVEEEEKRREFIVTAIFESREAADEVVLALVNKGVPRDALCVLSKASLYLDEHIVWPRGSGKLEITGATAGGGIVGALFGLAVFAIPGVGPVAAAGAVAASAFSSVAALSGVIGATGAALSKVLSDFDVEGLASNYLEQQIKKGSVFVTIDTRICPDQRDEISKSLTDLGGRLPRL